MFRTIFILFVVVCIFFVSCRKDDVLTSNTVRLEFSTDTVMFDTVFTNIGSTTHYLKVFNPYKQDVKISKLYLGRGGNSAFRLNINGTAGYSKSDIIIPGKDSIFIFVEVTVDPTGVNNPFVIQDSIVFVTNGVAQDVDLVAWGQNAHYINGEVIGTQTWTSDMPYLIYNSMAVDSFQTLTILQGTQIYFHRGSRMYVYPTASLNVTGTVDEPVVFQGDRLEEMYDDVPGQWVGIWLWGADGSQHSIDYAEIKNAIIGIEIDTLNNLTTPSLTITNTVIKNMNAVGLYALGSNVRAGNCVFANCGQYAVAFAIGGYYEIYHCTIGNYWKYSNRTTGSVLLNNYYKDINGVYQVRSLEKAFFGNCIIYGNKETELEIDQFPGVDYFEYYFDHCLLKVNSDVNTNDAGHYNAIVVNKEPYFADVDENLYEPDSTSYAIDQGDITIAGEYPFDLNGESRMSSPDLGAYERVD